MSNIFLSRLKQPIFTKSLLAAAVVSTICCIAAPKQAHAYGSVIAGGGNAEDGGTANLTADTMGSIFDGYLFATVYLEAGKSYACTSLTSTNLVGTSISSTITDSAANTINNTTNGVEFKGNVTPRVSGSTTSGASTNDDRVVITPVASDHYTFTVNNSSDSTAVEIKFTCMETTLYGGYNTNANPYNFLELSNTTSSTVTGTIKAFNFDGTQVVNTTFSVAANRRFDVDIHSSAGANKYGLIIVTHNGPFGAIQGNVSQYNGPVSALVLSATVPLKPRDQTF